MHSKIRRKYIFRKKIAALPLMYYAVFGIENELIKRWRKIPSVKLSPIEKKRNLSIRNYMIRVNMCPSYVTKTNDVYNFLRANHAI